MESEVNEPEVAEKSNTLRMTPNTIAVWITIAMIGATAIITYAKFETRMDMFMNHADDWHNNVAQELRDLRRNEIKELAEELDGVAVELTRLAERQTVIQTRLELIE